VSLRPRKLLFLVHEKHKNEIIYEPLLQRIARKSKGRFFSIHYVAK
jgi:hypothetical protein